MLEEGCFPNAHMRKLLAIAALTLIASLRVSAQTVDLSLDRCIGLAMEHNQTLQQARATVQSASASVTGAFGAFLPSLSLGAGYTRKLDGKTSTNVFGAAISPYAYSLSANANYTLFNGFANSASYERSSRLYDASELTLKRTVQDISYQVTQGFLNALRTEQIMTTREANLKVTREQLDRVKSLYEVGTVPRANVLQQETQEANDEVAYIQSRSDWNNARNDLVSLMGVDPSLEYSFSNAAVPPTISPDDQKAFRQRSGSVQEAIARAINNRYDVEASRNRLRGDEASLTTSRSGYYPNVGVSLGYGWQNDRFSNFSDYGSTTLGLNLTVPIFDRFATSTSVQITEAAIQTTKATQELLLQQVRAQIKRAYYDLETAEMQLGATDRAVQAAEENRRTADERYKLGAGTVLDFITAESQYLIAQVNKVNAVYGYLGAKAAVEYYTAMTNR